MTLTATERDLMNKRNLLSEDERNIIDQAFADMQFRAKAVNLPLKMDDNAAKLEAAFVRYLLACRGVDVSIIENGYPALEIDTVLYDTRPMLERTKNERRVVYNLLEKLADKGFYIDKIDDGEEVTKFRADNSDPKLKDAMELIFNLDECRVYVKKANYPAHYIYFVFGNADDGSEVVADNSYSEDDPDGFGKLMDEFDPEKVPGITITK